MMAKSKTTLLRFGALCAVIIIVLLELRGVRVLSSVAKFGLLIPFCLLIVGLAPFLVGVLLQCLFRKRLLHPLVSWTTAAIGAVGLQVFTGHAGVTAVGQPVCTFVISFLIWGVAVDCGVRFCQGWREGKQAVGAAPPGI